MDGVLMERVNDSDFRILTINDYDNVNKEKSNRMKSDNLNKLISESSHLFFLIIETSDKYFDMPVFESIIYNALIRSGKYFFVEICCDSNKFTRYMFNGTTLEELLNERLTDFFESIDKSLLLSSLQPSAINNLNNVPSPLHSILIRLVRTYDIVCNEVVEKKILENLVRNSKIDAFRAFLDLPIIDDGNAIQQTAFTTKAVDYKYVFDETLLFFAAGGSVDMLKLLLRLGADVHAQNYDSETASDYTKGYYRNLKILLEHDARFPHNFHLTYSKSFGNCNETVEEIQRICVERRNLHEAIENKNVKVIESFEEVFPLLKYAYAFVDEKPYSIAATTTALKKAMHSETTDTDFTMYLYLIDKGFCVNECDLHFMTNADKNKVSAIILNRLKTEQPSHVSFLRGKTFMYGVDTSQQGQYKEKIKKMYCELNKCSELENILKVVEHSKSLTVSLDFRNRTVVNLDITASNRMDGLTYHNLGRIYLSVADKSDNEIGGVLVHELTHFALHIIFNNNGRPYYKFDTHKEKLFDEIIVKINKLLKKLPKNHVVVKVINDVYTAYSTSSRPKELIARVPQLIALGLSESGRAEIAEIAELFNFYHDNVSPYMKKLTNNPEDFFIKREVNQLNEFLRHAEEIEKWNILLDKTCLNDTIYDGRNVKKVICDIPRLFLADFYDQVVKKSLICTANDSHTQKHCVEKYFVFASIEDFENSSTSTHIQRVWNLTSNITLILDVDKIVNLNSKFRTDFVQLVNKQVISKNIVVFGRDRSTLDSIFDTRNQCFILEYTWKHLESCYRKNLLSKQINFQGALVPLNKLVDDNFGCIPMKKLINEEEITIAATVDDYDEKTFVERNLRYCEREYTTADALSLTMEKVTSVLLSGFPAIGQSTVISRIGITLKNSNHSSLYWVAKINVEQLILASEDTTADIEILCKHFVCTASTSEYEFEVSLFRKLYEKSEVVFLFDSVVDLDDDYIERAVSLLQTLSEKNRLWITTYQDSPLKKQLVEKLSNIIDLELQTFSFSDHVTCVVKIWQKGLQLFDSTNRSILESCATEVLRCYDKFIRFPKLTAIIANKYLSYVKEYIENIDDEPFYPEDIYTNSNISDLHKELYSEKIQRRYTQSNAVNESAEAVILGMNMFTAFEQFADHYLEMNDRDDFEWKPLQMYANGAYELMRNGIIDYEYELSLNGCRSYFFWANYIIKSMESSFKVYGFLCNIIGRRDLELIKIIDGRMKDSALFHDIDFSKPSFTQKYSTKYKRLEFGDIEYLLKENVVLLPCFVLKMLEQTDSPKKAECFTQCSIFSLASEKCLRCVIDILWNISNVKFIEYLSLPDSHGCNPFQYAFMNFPQNDVDVVRDTTNVFDLSLALRSLETFDEKLKKSIEEKYENSTLAILVNRIMVQFTDHQDKLIYQYSTPAGIFKCRVSRNHFYESMERKWMTMKHLKFPIIDWAALTTKTIFQNVVCIIFNELNNGLVMKFYKWAERKIENVSTFNSFVADTFVNYFWNCTSEKHGKKIIAFVRKKINTEEALRQRGIDILNKMFNAKADMQKKFHKKIALFRSLLTDTEFEMVLFQKSRNNNGQRANLISKICANPNVSDETIYQVFSIVPLKTILENTDINEYLVYALTLYMVGRLDEIVDEVIIKSISNFISNQDRELVSNALTTFTIEGSFFHFAFLRRDMFMVQIIWQMAKIYLDQEQFRCQLLDQYNVYPNLVENSTSNEYLHHLPSILNTNCRTACYEFVPFKLNGGTMPKFAVSLHDKSEIYIGRCRLLNNDGYVLCKIMPNKYEPVGVIESDGLQQLQDSLEILIAKGLKWTKHRDETSQLYFRFKEKLLKRHNENVMLDDCTRVGEHYLAYDDAAARASETVSGFCYRQGLSLI